MAQGDRLDDLREFLDEQAPLVRAPLAPQDVLDNVIAPVLREVNAELEERGLWGNVDDGHRGHLVFFVNKPGGASSMLHYEATTTAGTLLRTIAVPGRPEEKGSLAVADITPDSVEETAVAFVKQALTASAG